MPADDIQASLIRFGLFELDARRCELRRDGSLVDVPPQSLRILTFLAARPNQLVTRSELKEDLWPAESHGDFDARLNFAVKKLREALGDSADQPRYIQTLRREGYRFVAPVETVDPNSTRTGPPPNPSEIGPELPDSSRTHGNRTNANVWPSWLRPQWALLTIVCALIVGAYWFWRGPHDRSVSQLAFSGRSLVARNARGEILWTYDFGQPLDLNAGGLARQRAGSFDLGEGRRGDILIAAPLSSSEKQPSTSDALYCFSASGKLRWHHAFDEKPRFGGRDDIPPWYATPLMVLSDSSRPTIWCAGSELLGALSTLIEFDRDGNRLGQFINRGHMASLSHVRNATGSYVLVGGISNQCNCAMLAVLREDQPSGSSPPLPGSAWTCDNCPGGSPYRYILFPRSELTELSGTAYNNLKLIHVDGSHVWVAVSETSEGDAPGKDWEKYDLSDDFVPTSFEVSDHYWTLHRQMEAEGKIHHTAEQCPDGTHAKKVRVWTKENQWKEIAVPRRAGP